MLYLNLATGKFGVYAAYRICEALELQKYTYTTRLRKQSRFGGIARPEG